MFNFFDSWIPCYSTSTMSTAEALKIYKADVESEPGENTTVVRRSRLLNTTFESMTRKSFNCKKGLKVEFSGEEAVDYGGPRR